MAKAFINSVKVVNTTNLNTEDILDELKTICNGIVVDANIIHTAKYNLAQIANAIVGVATILNTKRRKTYSAQILSTETILLK